MPPQLPDNIPQTVTLALAEDIGSGDLTARLIPEGSTARAQVIAREYAVLCGQAWFDECFRQLDPAIRIEWRVADGEAVTPNQTLCRLEGPARPLLTGERSALNFLQTLSGTATLTRQYVNKLRGTRAQILDTRKTLPGLRSAQKYAVRCGGGYNHRQGLFDAILIKENHILAAGSITAAIRAAQAVGREVPIEIETENLAEVEEALAAGAGMILLDNFPTHLLARAVSLGRQYERSHGRRILFEASGNITLDNIRDVADTGVDRISIGGLTKHVTAVDLSLRFEL